MTIFDFLDKHYFDASTVIAVLLFLLMVYVLDKS